MNSKQLKTMLRILFVIPALAIFAVTGCKGPAGADGAAGTDGTNGVDGNVTCLQCHTQNHMDSIEVEWATSIHATSEDLFPGTTVFDYTGSRSECSRCHSGNGFVQFLNTGLDTLPVAGEHLGCRHCHSGHQTFDPQDYALRVTDGGYTVVDTTWMTLGEGNNGNLCINCHQPRTKWEEMVTTAGDSANVTSSHAGPHHGPQSAVILGTSGTIAGTPHTHKTAGCTTCHMGEFDATDTIGGHTWRPNPANCSTCHTVPADFDHNSFISTEFDPAFATLEGKLQTAGIIDANASTVPGTYSLDVYKAWWNYMLLKEDKSHGVHNPDYAMSLLNTSNSLLP